MDPGILVDKKFMNNKPEIQGLNVQNNIDPDPDIVLVQIEKKQRFK